jgi:hypothetical protein
MWSTLAISFVWLAAANAPASTAQDLLPPQVTAPVCPGAPTLPAPEAPALQAKCTATADCSDGSQLSCAGTGPAPTCTSVNSDCASGVRGFVECNGTRQDCPACPPQSFLCNCIRPDGLWGVRSGGECALIRCIKPE